MDGCNAVSLPVIVTVKSLPSPLKIKALAASTVCEPESVSFGLDPNALNIYDFNFQWNVNGSPVFAAADTNYTVNSVGGGSISVTVSGYGCSKTSPTKNFTIKQKPTASFIVSGNATICSGGLVNMTAPNISGYTYTWLKDGVSAGTGSTKNFKVAGNYTIVAKLNGCTDTTSPSVPLFINPLPIASISSNTATTFCAGDSCLIVASPSNQLNYQWMTGNNIAAITPNNYFASYISNTYKVIITDTNGCVSKVSANNVKTKVNAIPTASIIAMGNTTISSTGSVKLKANPSSGVSWQWYYNGNIIANATNSSFVATNGGNYTVAITKLGCTGISGNTTIIQTTPKEEISTTTMNEGSFELSAFPNPVSEVLTVSVSGLNEVNGTIQVMDVMGKVVKSFNCKEEENQFAIDSRQWASGVYFIRYKDDMGRTGMVKVVKE